MQLMMFNPFAVCLNPWPRGGRFWAEEHVDGQFKYLIGGIHGDVLNYIRIGESQDEII